MLSLEKLQKWPLLTATLSSRIPCNCHCEAALSERNHSRQGNYHSQVRELRLRHGVVRQSAGRPGVEWVRTLMPNPEFNTKVDEPGTALCAAPSKSLTKVTPNLKRAFTKGCGGSSSSSSSSFGCVRDVLPYEGRNASNDASTESTTLVVAGYSSDEDLDKERTAKHAKSLLNRIKAVDLLHDSPTETDITSGSLPHLKAPRTGKKVVEFRTRPRSREWVFEEETICPWKRLVLACKWTRLN